MIAQAITNSNLLKIDLDKIRESETVTGQLATAGLSNSSSSSSTNNLAGANNHIIKVSSALAVPIHDSTSNQASEIILADQIIHKIRECALNNSLPDDEDNSFFKLDVDSTKEFLEVRFILDRITTACKRIKENLNMNVK